MRLPVVCIIGRPNVGKSTLFNRILRRRVAVVSPVSGVTRDRHYAVAEWDDRQFALIDTGGLVLQSDASPASLGTGEMQRHITAQSKLAIEESDAVVFVVDGIAGPQPEDRQIARFLLKSGKPAVFVVNKIDKRAQEGDIYEFTKLGPFDPLGISALGGQGIPDLLERIGAAVAPLSDGEGEEEGERPIHVALVGRPNVGKSSLANALLGSGRMIVSPEPGTTRDSIDTTLTYEGQPFVLIDTAGLRKRARVKDELEFFTALRSIRAVHRSDIVCVLLDASEPLSLQDFKIAETAIEAGKGLFFAVNKWDLVEKDTDTAGAYAKDLRSRIRTISWAPIVFISALTGQRAARVLTMARTIAGTLQKRIATSELNDSVLADAASKPPPAIKGRYIKINYVTQLPDPPPTFILFCNHPDLIAAPYIRYLTRRLRERYGFEGVPIRLVFRKKN